MMLATGSYWSSGCPATWYASNVGWMTWSRPFDGMPLMRVDVPVVDGVRVAGGLTDDVAVQAVVGARDALCFFMMSRASGSSRRGCWRRPACGRRHGWRPALGALLRCGLAAAFAGGGLGLRLGGRGLRPSALAAAAFALALRRPWPRRRPAALAAARPASALALACGRLLAATSWPAGDGGGWPTGLGLGVGARCPGRGRRRGRRRRAAATPAIESLWVLVRRDCGQGCWTRTCSAYLFE